MNAALVFFPNGRGLTLYRFESDSLAALRIYLAESTGERSIVRHGSVRAVSTLGSYASIASLVNHLRAQGCVLDLTSVGDSQLFVTCT